MVHPHLEGLERVEQQAWADLVRLAPKAFASAIDLESARIGGALFVMAAKLPQFQFNFLHGAGLGDDDGRCIAEAVRRFKAAGQTRFIVQVPQGPKAGLIESFARDAGLQPTPLAWAKFARSTAEPPIVDTSVVIREAGHSEREMFGQTAVAGFGMPAAMSGWLAQIVGEPGWHAYLSFDGETPIGAGALYVNGDYAWCGIGSTVPNARKRGGQSAMLARRISDAGSLRARMVATETGVPQTDQPAPSYKNILSSGFDVAYVRPNWTLPA